MAHDTPVKEFGKKAMSRFLIDPEYRNLNQGSFGTIPKVIQDKMREYQDMAERRPDPFIRYEFPGLLDESRAAVAKILHAPVEACVFVPNATVGVNTVLKGLEWNEDGKDVIVYFSTIYGGCGKTIDYVVDSNRGLVSSHGVELVYPIEDDEIISRFRKAVKEIGAQGKRARVCIFDVVSSLPGVRFPFEDMTATCKELGVLSLIDGAQGIGMVHLDLGKVDPDFFVSNCHKWLHVPRGCAVFYVPVRNQPLIPSPLPTSHGYQPRAGYRFSPLPPSAKSVFVNNFEFVGTVDNAPYLCVKDSIKWREEILGGEDEVIGYLWELAKEGGKKAAEILGTEVLENKKGTLTNCGMVNVRLPLVVGEEGQQETAEGVVAADDKFGVLNWMLQTLVREHNTFVALFIHGDKYWARLSAQVFLDEADFEWGARTLKEVAGRAVKEYRPEIKAKM